MIQKKNLKILITNKTLNCVKKQCYLIIGSVEKIQKIKIQNLQAQKTGE